jgi:two-component system chemotaxis sensor kinase CheA
VDKKKLQERLMAGFLAELQEHVESWNADLLALEKEPEQEAQAAHVHSLFRTAHTLKSASRAVGLGALEHAAHRVEHLMARVRGRELDLAPPLVQLLFDCADAFRAAGALIGRGEPLERSHFEALLARVADAHGAPPQEPTPPARPVAPPTPPPTTPPPVETTPAPGPASVRVAAHKLDSLLTHSAEMRVALRRLQTGHESLSAIHADIERLRRDWDTCAPLLQAGQVPLVKSRSRMLRGFSERLRRLDDELRRERRSLFACANDLAHNGRVMERDVQAVRMLPFRDACKGLDRTVRDLAHDGGKSASLLLEGGEVEMDRSVLEELRDPLLHLVRNAIAHGVEPPVERLAAGKDPSATIRVAALLRRGQVEVRVEDDGRGVDAAAIREAALLRGMAEHDLPANLLSLLFVPGFSTVQAPTELSGRGVGLDVVKTRVEAVRGAVEIASEPGNGTYFTLTLPLTLTTVHALLVAHQTSLFAIPCNHVSALRRVPAQSLRSADGRDVLVIDGESVPVAPLSSALNGATPPTLDLDRKLQLVEVSSAAGRVALLVDELLDIQEILVKPLSPRLGRIRTISGGAMLHTGRTALVLYPPAIVERVLGHPGAVASHRTRQEEERTKVHRLLLVDDSLTTRSLERMILESAGYQVTVAAHGAEAWELLKQREVDLVVADVEMPHMDGIELTRTIRDSERLSDLPVILVTGLDSEADRARGLDAGANAYIVKSSFDQRVLLETIAQLL